MDLKSTYNRIAEDWHRDHQSDDWWVAGTDVFLKLLPAGAAVLDVGCGGGTKSKYLAAKGFRVTGIDFSENMIEIARREVPGANFQVIEVLDLLKLPGEFDGVFAQAVLLHVLKQDAPRALRDMVGKLKPGGCLYAAVKGKKDGQHDEEIVSQDDYGYSYQRFFSYYTLSELEKYFQDLGLAIVYRNADETSKGRWIQLIGREPR